jgi:thiamine biosynthesis lipoprotein
MITTAFRSMGGTVEVQLVGGTPADAGRIESLFAEHERTLSRFMPDSELCALNNAAPARFEASPLLFDAVSEALGWACVTDGIFDPTVIDALEASGYDRTFDDIAGGAARAVAERPRPRARQDAWRAIELDVERSVIVLPAGIRLDMGGIGKGFTVDRAIAALGPGTNAMVNASGDLYAAGDGPDGDGWYVGVQDPFALDLDLAVLNVNDCGVATSGSIKRNWTMGDARYHHLIDPREQRSSTSELLTVTVIAPTATQADVLAKTAFILGPSAGLRVIERFDGAECLAVTAAGDVLTTSGMAEHYA